MGDALDDLAGLLSDAKVAVRREASGIVAGLTGSPQGIQMLTAAQAKVFPPLLRALHDEDGAVKANCGNALVNLSADREACEALLDLGVVARAVELFREGDGARAKGGDGEEVDPHYVRDVTALAKVLSNVTQYDKGVEQILQKGKGALEGLFVRWLVEMLASPEAGDASGAGIDKDYLAAVVTNVSQDEAGRRILMDGGGAHVNMIAGDLEQRRLSSLRQECLCSALKNVCVGAAQDGTVEPLVASGLVPRLTGLLTHAAKANAADPGTALAAGADQDAGLLGENFGRVARLALAEAVASLSCEEEAREAMWKCGAPDAIEKYYQWETDGEIGDVLERIADVLVQESGQEGPVIEEIE